MMDYFFKNSLGRFVDWIPIYITNMFIESKETRFWFQRQLFYAYYKPSVP